MIYQKDVSLLDTNKMNKRYWIKYYLSKVK